MARFRQEKKRENSYSVPKMYPEHAMEPPKTYQEHKKRKAAALRTSTLCFGPTKPGVQRETRDGTQENFIIEQMALVTTVTTGQNKRPRIETVTSRSRESTNNEGAPSTSQRHTNPSALNPPTPDFRKNLRQYLQKMNPK